VGLPIFWVEVNGLLVSLYRRFPLAKFPIRDPEVIESLGKIGVQPSGFTVLFYSVRESALRRKCNPSFMVLSGRAARLGSFIHNGGDFIA